MIFLWSPGICNAWCRQLCNPMRGFFVDNVDYHSKSRIWNGSHPNNIVTVYESNALPFVLWSTVGIVGLQRTLKIKKLGGWHTKMWPRDWEFCKCWKHATRRKGSFLMELEPNVFEHQHFLPWINWYLSSPAMCWVLHASPQHLFFVCCHLWAQSYGSYVDLWLNVILMTIWIYAEKKETEKSEFWLFYH